MTANTLAPPGVMGVGPDPDGLDGHLRPNHVGPFLLTCLLAPSLHSNARVVNVGSNAHYRGSLHIGADDRIQGTPRTWYGRYARSKLCNVLFTLELQRRLPADSHIVACCVSPGRVYTNIFNNVPGCLRPMLHTLASCCFQTPEQGARTVVYACTSPAVSRRSLYLHDGKERVPSSAARDAALAAALWRASERMAGLRGNERCPLLFGGHVTQ